MAMAKSDKSGSFENLFVNESQRQTYAEISSLKKRLQLLEGERKANYQLNDEQLKRNEIRIQQLRETNQRLKKERQEQAKKQDTYFQVISDILGSKKKAYEFKGKNFEETKDMLDCKIGDVQNKLNLLAFKKNKVQQDLRKIVEKEKSLQKTDNKKNPWSEEIKSIENKIAEMKIKVTEGENLQTRYKHMLTTLTNSNLAKRVSINQMESDLVHQTKEIGNLTQTLATATYVQKEARAQLGEMEEETLAEYSKREQSLFEARLRLQEIREKMEAIGSKLTYPKIHMIHRDSALAEGLLVGYDATGIRMSDEMKSQNVIERVYNQLQEMTGESDPQLIVNRYVQQREHSVQLLTKLDEVASQVRKCKLRKRFLEDKLQNLQYSGGQERQRLDDQYNEIKAEFDTLEKNKLEKERNIRVYHQLMEEVFGKLAHLCNAIDLEVPDTDIMETGEKIVELLKLLQSQLEEIMEANEIFVGSQLASPVDKEFGSEHESLASGVGSAAGGSDYFFGSSGKLDDINRLGDLGRMSDFEGSNYQLSSPHIQIQTPSSMRQLESPIPSSPVPIKSAEKKSESSEEEDAVGRNFIKRQSQVLIEAKTRKGGRFNVTMTGSGPGAAKPRNF